MKSILFVVPPTLEVGKMANKMRHQEATIPYGVLSMASYLNYYKNLSDINFDVNIIDFNVKPYSTMTIDDQLEQYRKELVDISPDVVGISAMYNHIYPYIKIISDKTKEVIKDSISIAGGPCVMAFYEELLDEVDSLDAICYAEGEIPIFDLMTSSNGYELIQSHPSFLTKIDKDNGKIPQSSFVMDLDLIPRIDFELVKLGEYGSHRTSFRPNKKDKEFILPISTTRGCPFNCVFCLAGSLHGKKVRKMSVERVIEDVRFMIDKYGVNTLSIEDDQFLLDTNRAKDILRGIKEFGLTLIADSGFTVSMIDQELTDLMYEAGLKMAIIAIESGSEYVLNEIIDKPINLNNVKSAVKFLRKSNILVHAFLVTGLPGEREVDRQETVDFIKEVGIDWTYITCATPVKGSRLYDICVENNYNDNNSKGEDAFYVSVINTETFTSKEITRKAYLMNLELNFVNNHQMELGNYDIAAKYMEHVCNKYPDHAFAYYYLAKALELSGKSKDIIEPYYNKYRELINSSDEWREYAQIFELEI